MKPISIRQAIPTDAPQICRLLGQLGYQRTQAAVENRIKTLSEQTDTVVLVAENDRQSRIVGCIHILMANRLAEGRYGEIASLVIAETHRGGGIGQLLVEDAARWLREKGMSRMRVRCNTVRKDAHRFYKRLGFDETKSQKIFDHKLS